jgi:hypothetical protein
MDSQLDARLSAIEKKLDSTYDMVRKMRGAQKRATALKLAYWAFLIILGIIAASMIKPYIAQLGAVYGVGAGDSTASYSDLLKSINQ